MIGEQSSRKSSAEHVEGRSLLHLRPGYLPHIGLILEKAITTPRESDRLIVLVTGLRFGLYCRLGCGDPSPRYARVLDYYVLPPRTLPQTHTKPETLRKGRFRKARKQGTFHQKGP